MTALPPGFRLAGYRVEQILGRGGMGIVYLARHPELPRSDAVKVLDTATAGPDGEAFRARFLREAEIAAALDHPHIVTIHNRGTEGDRLWIAMQYVPGTDGARELDRLRAGLGLRRSLRVAAEVAGALDHAHGRGSLHRDVKPANILLAATDGRGDERALLTDFGLAKIVDDAGDPTVAGTVFVTPSYASPEQLRGDRCDARTDQYSLAASLFHLICGQTPFPGATTAEIMRGHLADPVPRLSSRAGDVPPEVDAVMERAMAKDPDHRFAGCGQFVAALTQAASTPRAAYAPTRQRPVARPVVAPPRGPVPTAVILAALMALGVVTAAVLYLVL
ncbi:serine/threonine-protein kinase [Williamsia sterculiae]|uniref:non-specific serine/threonine protein kinase n=1 Tax=Williamsia sterculiae TaxID=1344003 RepID=A0A1N7H6E4_9NOCA|nr:serine/threonine-protein kinase [Williamsia sterculiae]SIS20419.1 serine/threonine protein kinase [Williamsia sterculiae]